MKKLLFLTLIFVFIAIKGFSQLGVGTASPDASAMLDVFSLNKGFLPPRIALTATNSAAPVTNPATGLLIYNMATAGTGLTSVKPGYYYWNGTAWNPVNEKGAAPGDMLYWDGMQWVRIPVGANGTVLTLCNGVPTWGGCPETTVTIKPANNPSEMYAYSYFPNSLGYGTSQLPVMAWTHNGTPSVSRAYITFNYTLPAGAVISSAKLSLYAATPNPNSGDLINAHYGAANGMYIQRITSAWSGASATWNNQPTTTGVNQVMVPHTAVSTQNDLDIDVTQLVKDMQQNGNNGFAIRLITENYYNSRQYISSYNSDAARHPKLVITYKP